MRDVYGTDGVVPIGYEGAVDADGHILEPPTLWEEYLEARYLDRALRVRVNDDGKEYLEIDGRPSTTHAPGILSELGRGNDDQLGQQTTNYLDNVPFGAMDPTQRVALLDAEHLDAAVLYPSIGIMWEADIDDPELTQAHCRAYNRWIADFCRDSDGRLVPVAHLSLTDPVAAATELERAVADGCAGAFIGSWTVSGLAPGHPEHDPVYAAAQRLGVPIAIHPTVGTRATWPRLYKGVLGELYTPHTHMGRDHVRQAFTTFFDYATFERFPELTLVLLEAGAGWLGHTLDRLDELHGVLGARVASPTKPSEHFARQCYISCDPNERTIPALMSLYGADRFFWASDYPHPDHSIDYLQQVENLVAGIPEAQRPGILGDNVRRCFGIA